MKNALRTRIKHRNPVFSRRAGKSLYLNQKKSKRPLGHLNGLHKSSLSQW